MSLSVKAFAYLAVKGAFKVLPSAYLVVLRFSSAQLAWAKI